MSSEVSGSNFQMGEEGGKVVGIYLEKYSIFEMYDSIFVSTKVFVGGVRQQKTNIIFWVLQSMTLSDMGELAGSELR